MPAYDPYRSKKPQKRREVPKQYGDGKLTGAFIAWLGHQLKEIARTAEEEPKGSPELWAWTFLVLFGLCVLLLARYS